MKKDLSSQLYIAGFSQNSEGLGKKWDLPLEINETCISGNFDECKKSETLTKVKKQLLIGEKRNKKIAHGPFTEIIPAAIDDEMKKVAILRLNQACELLKKVGIKNMVVHTGYIPFIYFKNWHLEKSVLFWQEFMKNKEKDFYLYIENVLDDEAEMLKNLIDRIDDDRVKVCLDTGHANAMKESDSIYKWIEVLGKRIGHFHLHSNDGGGKDSHLPLGEGEIDGNLLLETILKNCENDVSLTIESRDGEASLEWMAKNGWLRKRGIYE